MFKSFQDFKKASAAYLELTGEFIDRHKLNERITVDHICFKCGVSEEYDQIRSILETDPPSTYVYQVILAQRRVGYIGLRDEIRMGNVSIGCVELADRKPVLDDDPGFHHVEIFPVKMSYDELIGEMMDAGEDIVLKKKRPHHTTHDIALPSGFLIRFTDKPLIKHIIERELSK
jgi:predicted metalloenzyme YecM